jgi:uncharacterized protein YjiS (DUF1127 family)
MREKKKIERDGEVRYRESCKMREKKRERCTIKEVKLTKIEREKLTDIGIIRETE